MSLLVARADQQQEPTAGSSSGIVNPLQVTSTTPGLSNNPQQAISTIPRLNNNPLQAKSSSPWDHPATGKSTTPRVIPSLSRDLTPPALKHVANEEVKENTMFNSNYFVYITTNFNRTTYYVGVTNNLANRLNQHFENSGNPKTFAGRYYCYHLVYYERFTSPTHAIEREKQLKGWNRGKKEALIKMQNPLLKFLNEEIW